LSGNLWLAGLIAQHALQLMLASVNNWWNFRVIFRIFGFVSRIYTAQNNLFIIYLTLT